MSLRPPVRVGQLIVNGASALNAFDQFERTTAAMPTLRLFVEVPDS
jgi:hypothetical protein